MISINMLASLLVKFVNHSCNSDKKIRLDFVTQESWFKNIDDIYTMPVSKRDKNASRTFSSNTRCDLTWNFSYF